MSGGHVDDIIDTMRPFDSLQNLLLLMRQIEMSFDLPRQQMTVRSFMDLPLHEKAEFLMRLNRASGLLRHVEGLIFAEALRRSRPGGT